MEGVAIFRPRFINQFHRLYRYMYPGSVLDDPEKHLRKFLERAKPINRNFWEGVFSMMPDREYVEHDGLIFTVGRVGASFRLIAISLVAHLAMRREIRLELQPRAPLDLLKVHFSNHALQRIKERYFANSQPEPKKFDLILQGCRMLADSTEENAISEAWAADRFVRNGHVPVRYFATGPWRAVVGEFDNGSFLVLTIERKF